MTKTILLVEDDATDEKLMRIALGQSGTAITLVVARDGAAALAHLRACDPRVGDLPALVLLDLSLPRIGGFDVLRELRASDQTRHVPVVVLTSSRQPEDIERSYSLGANGYVRKPSDLLQLEAATKAIATFWMQWNDPSPAGA